MAWSGKFKNGESFNDLSDAELEKFSSEIDESTASENKDAPLPEVTEPSTVNVVGFAHPTSQSAAQNYAQAMMAPTMMQKEAPFGLKGVMVANAALHPIESAGHLYQAVRDMMAIPAGALTSLAAKANEAQVDAYGNTINPKEGYWEAVARTQPEEIEKARRNEGIGGLLSDPVNLAMMGPTTKLLQAGAKAIGAGGYLASHPVIAKTLLGATEGATAAGLSGLDPNKSAATMRDIAFGAGAGGILSGIGGLMRNDALESFPGVVRANKKLAKSGGEIYSPAEIEDFIQGARAETPWYKPQTIGQKAYGNLEGSLRERAGEGYERALETIDPRFATTPIQLAAKYTNETNLGELAGKLRDAVYNANKARNLNLSEKEVSSYVDDYLSRMQYKHGAPNASDLPDVTPRDLMSSKQILNEDIYNTRLGEVTGRQKKIAKAMHSALDETLHDMATTTSRPFREELGDAPALYRKASRLEDLLEFGANDASRHRTNFGPVVSFFGLGPQYWANDLKYKIGGNIAKAAFPAISTETSR